MLRRGADCHSRLELVPWRSSQDCCCHHHPPDMLAAVAPAVATSARLPMQRQRVRPPGLPSQTCEGNSKSEWWKLVCCARALARACLRFVSCVVLWTIYACWPAAVSQPHRQAARASSHKRSASITWGLARGMAEAQGKGGTGSKCNDSRCLQWVQQRWVMTGWEKERAQSGNAHAVSLRQQSWISPVSCSSFCFFFAAAIAAAAAAPARPAVTTNQGLAGAASCNNQPRASVDNTRMIV